MGKVYEKVIHRYKKYQQWTNVRMLNFGCNIQEIIIKIKIKTKFLFSITLATLNCYSPCWPRCGEMHSQTLVAGRSAGKCSSVVSMVWTRAALLPGIYSSEAQRHKYRIAHGSHMIHQVCCEEGLEGRKLPPGSNLPPWTSVKLGRSPCVIGVWGPSTPTPSGCPSWPGPTTIAVCYEQGSSWPGLSSPKCEQ